MGIIGRDEALNLAKEQGLDLVEVSKPGADTVVCRIMDYGKHLYRQSKTKRHKQTRIELKEIKFRPGTDEGDVQTKVNKLRKFLLEGNKVKVTVRFRGRELSHQEIGKVLMDRILKDLEEIGTIEQLPKLEGRQLVMTMGPKRK